MMVFFRKRFRRHRLTPYCLSKSIAACIWGKAALRILPRIGQAAASSIGRPSPLGAV